MESGAQRAGYDLRSGLSNKSAGMVPERDSMTRRLGEISAVLAACGTHLDEIDTRIGIPSEVSSTKTPTIDVSGLHGLTMDIGSRAQRIRERLIEIVDMLG